MDPFYSFDNFRLETVASALLGTGKDIDDTVDKVAEIERRFREDKRSLARYNLIYGSLGAFLALLSWVYMASLIVLGGAHVGAAIAANTRHAIIEEGVVESGDSAEGECAPERERGVS